MINLLKWTDPAPACSECPYNHTIAVTLFGKFLLTWKGWKDKPMDSLGFDETPWDEPEYLGWNSIEEAQQWAEAEMSRRCKGFINPPQHQSLTR